MDDAVSVQRRDVAGDAQVLDAFVIGAGFGGMYSMHRLRQAGLTVLGVEAGGDIGGVWYWNRYPGARCDVMSLDYCYSFSEELLQEWTWSERFAAQPEILAYANYVADKLDIRRSFKFNTRANAIAYNDATRRWTVKTDAGEVFETVYLIMASGPLSVPKKVDIPGAASFKGELYQSAKWPHEKVVFEGKRVAVVGTGSSGIQIVPVVAETAQELWVFQRTPSFTLPMRNAKLEADYVSQVKEHYPALRAAARNTFTGGVRPVSTRPFFSVPKAEREELMEDAWRRGGLAFLGTFADLLFNQKANDIVADFVRNKIGDIVKDPVTAEKLKPKDYPIFARRPCLDTNYYESYNLPHVKLVDCFEEPIVEITPAGIRTPEREIALEMIILATGYDGLTGAMMAIDVVGRGGRSLKEKWAEGARSYLGLAMEGFPNLFIVGGANGPSALANYILLDEQNVDWIMDCIAYLRRHKLHSIEATAEAESEWLATVASLAEKSLFPRANTWYVGANIPGKPRVFSIYAGGFNRYREICDEIARADYRGFTFEPQ